MKTSCSLAMKICTAVLLVTLAPGLAQAQLVKMYRLTELLPASGGESRAYAINKTGQIIGWMDSADNKHSAFWHNDASVDLHGTVHFDLAHPLFDQEYSEAYDISNAGQIVGTARTEISCPPDFVITCAFVLRPAVLTDLATPYPGDALANLWTLGRPCYTAYDSAATGISNRNHIVGWADREDGTIHAFIVEPDPATGGFFIDADVDTVNDLMVDLGTLNPNATVSSATAVNDAGQVTGYSYTTSAATAAYHAFLWTSGGGMVSIGTLGGTNSWGRDINNNGVIVGESDYDAPTGEHYTRAFIYQGGTMTDLGTLRDDRSKGFSAASAINDAGVVVGWAENEDRQRRAFVYEDGAMKDLNDLLYLVDEDGEIISSRLVLTEARDVNEDGSIVGWGTLGTTTDASERGFLVTPVWVDPNALVEDDDKEPGPGLPGTGTVDGSIIGGTPGSTSALNNGADPNGITPTPTPGGFCAPASLAVIPLTMLGIVWMRRSYRRW